MGPSTSRSPALIILGAITSLIMSLKAGSMSALLASLDSQR